VTEEVAYLMAAGKQREREREREREIMWWGWEQDRAPKGLSLSVRSHLLSFYHLPIAHQIMNSSVE
jgi:hypothetical protein